MRNNGVNFVGSKKSLVGDYLVSEKALFVAELKNKLKELFNYDIPFKPSQAPENYTYSIYKTLFGG